MWFLYLNLNVVSHSPIDVSVAVGVDISAWCNIPCLLQFPSVGQVFNFGNYNFYNVCLLWLVQSWYKFMYPFWPLFVENITCFLWFFLSSHFLAWLNHSFAEFVIVPEQFLWFLPVAVYCTGTGPAVKHGIWSYFRSFGSGARSWRYGKLINNNIYY